MIQWRHVHMCRYKNIIYFVYRRCSGFNLKGFCSNMSDLKTWINHRQKVDLFPMLLGKVNILLYFLYVKLCMFMIFQSFFKIDQTCQEQLKLLSLISQLDDFLNKGCKSLYIRGMKSVQRYMSCQLNLLEYWFKERSWINQVINEDMISTTVFHEANL